jgi:hypothetical protein
MGRPSRERVQASKRSDIGLYPPEAASQDLLGDAWRYLERAERTLGLLGGTAVGGALNVILDPFDKTAVGRWLPDWEQVPEAFSAFEEQRRQGDWDSAITAAQEEMDAGKFFWGAAEGLTSAFVPTGGPALAGAKLLRAAPKLAGTLGRVAPIAARPGVTSGIETGLRRTGKALRAPWEAEEWVGRQAIRPLAAGWRALRGTPSPTAQLAETVDAARPIPDALDPPVGERAVTKEPWAMTRAEFRQPPSAGRQAATNEYIRTRTGANTPQELLSYYQNKYPELEGVTIGGLRATEVSGPLVNDGATRLVFDGGKFNPRSTQIHLTKDADLVVTRHEVEHLLDAIHDFTSKVDVDAPRGWALGEFGRYDHAEFNASDYLHRSLVRDAISEGRLVPDEVLRDYPELAPTTAAPDAPVVARAGALDEAGAVEQFEFKVKPPRRKLEKGQKQWKPPKTLEEARDQFNDVVDYQGGRQDILNEMRNPDTAAGKTLQGHIGALENYKNELDRFIDDVQAVVDEAEKILEPSTAARGAPDVGEVAEEFGDPDLDDVQSQLYDLVDRERELRGEISAAQAARVGDRSIIKPPKGHPAARLSGARLRALAEHEGLNPYASDWWDGIDSVVVKEIRRAHLPNVTGARKIKDMQAELVGVRRQIRDLERAPPGVSTGAPMPPPRTLPALQDIGEAITIASREDVGRKIANIPVIRAIIGPLNRAAVAGKVELQGLIGRAILLSEGQQKTQTVMARLMALGKFNDVFGRVDPKTGLIAEGHLAGAAPNDLRTHPDNIIINGRKAELTTAERAWVDTAQSIEKEKNEYLKKNGLKIKELSFEEGGEYAGRRVYAKFDRNGNLLYSDSFSSAAGPGRIGSKTAFDKARRFKSQKEALDHGFRYLSEEDTLSLNVQAAYNKVTNKRFLEWMEKSIPEKLPEGATGLTLRRLSKKGFRPIEFGEQFAGELPPSRVFGFEGADAAGRAQEAEAALRAALHPQLSKRLAMVNQANAVGRFFTLAGDVSPFMIQLLPLVIRHPKKLWRAIEGFGLAFGDADFHARYLNKNADLINRHRGMLTSLQGNEMTEALERGGLLHAKLFPMPQYRKILTPFQRGFNASMDVSGVELAKGLEHLAMRADGSFDPVKMADLDAYINEVRGLASSQRIGVSGTVRQWETALMLAPRYNRAIAALLWDALQGTARTVTPGYFGEQTLRTKLARDAMGATLGGFAALNAGITLGLYLYNTDRDKWDWEDAKVEMGEHLNPTSGRFFTWNIGGRNIGPGSKIRSVVQLFARSAVDPSLFDPRNIDDAGGVYRWAMNNPAIKFLRGSAAPVLSSGMDVLSGYTYVGEPTFQGIGDPESWKNTVSNVLLHDIMPIAWQAVLLEGGLPTPGTLRRESETGQLGGRVTGAVVELFGGRGSPLTRTQLEQEKHRRDPEMRDTPWENVPRETKLRYQRLVEEEQGGKDYRGPTGEIREEIDDTMQGFMDKMGRVENMLKEVPFATGHYGEDARKTMRQIESDMYDALDPLYDKLWPGTPEIPEIGTMDHILWQYGQIFEEAGILREDKLDPVTGAVVVKAGEMDYEEVDRLLGQLWGSLDPDEADWLLNSIRLREADYPPKVQRMKQAIRWLGTVKVDLNGVPTGYWDIGEHPDVKKSLATQVPELNAAEIERWMETTSSSRRALERVDERYARLAKVKASMQRGEGLWMGLIKSFKLQFIQGSPEGWYYGMSMYYPDNVYGADRAIDAMDLAYQRGVPMPESTTDVYRERYQDYIKELSGVR